MNTDEILLIENFTNYIKSNENFSFVRFGDAELLCMSGQKHGHTKDLHNYSEKLGKRLVDSYSKLSNCDKVFLGKWDRNNCHEILDRLVEYFKTKNLCSFHILSSELNYVNDYQYKFYETLKNTKRKKIFVAHEGLKKMTSFLNSDEMIVIPKINAFDSIEQIEDSCLKSYVPNAIYIYCAGMNTKLLISKVLENHKDSTHIDVGSAFEPYYNTKTRSKHMSSEVLTSFYKNLL